LKETGYIAETKQNTQNQQSMSYEPKPTHPCSSQKNSMKTF